MLRLVDANMADDGNYTCVVSNELGTISRTFVVNIVGNIRFFNDSEFILIYIQIQFF